MRLLTICIAALMLQACSKNLYEPGNLTPSRVTVQEEKFYQKTRVGQVSDAYLEGLAYHYGQHGDGPMHLEVAYNPKIATSRKAMGKIKRYAQTLRDYGVDAILTSNTIPVHGECSLIVTYDYYTAHAAQDCNTMPGFASTSLGGDRDYRMGCTIENVLARQIARPKDLLGRDIDDPVSDGRSAANIVNAVRSGAFNEPLGGQQASE